jgi:hypothetical protein
MAEDNKTDEENDPDAIDDAPAELNEDELDDDDGDSDDDDDDDSAQDTPRTKRKKSDEDDDDEELLDDDVEEDLDKILKDRLVAADDDEETSAPVSGASGEQLQPKQRDEQLCSTCFLLVRSNAPNCPIGDDDCPIFS